MKTAKTKKTESPKRSVSFPPELAKRAEERAASMNRSFSNYIQQLVIADTQKQAA